MKSFYCFVTNIKTCSLIRSFKTEIDILIIALPNFLYPVSFSSFSPVVNALVPVSPSIYTSLSEKMTRYLPLSFSHYIMWELSFLRLPSAVFVSRSISFLQLNKYEYRTIFKTVNRWISYFPSGLIAFSDYFIEMNTL